MIGTLGYLTENQLTGYPLKDNRSTGIPDGWFLDAVISLFNPNAARVYISSIYWNTGISPGITLTFTAINKDNSTSGLGTPVIDAPHIIDMSQPNAAYSFWSYGNSNFAIKLIVGSGLVSAYSNQVSFSGVYTYSQSEISSGAIVMAHPKVTSFTAKTITDVSPTTITAGNPVVFSTIGYNTTLSFDAVHTLFDIDVVPNTGLGLYDNCPGSSGIVTALYSLNGVTPSTDGNLFFRFDDCYSSAVTTGTDIYVDPNAFILMYTPTITPYLDPDNNFLTLDPFKVPVDLSSTVGHGLTFSNTCSAKCSPDNMNAFAEYLNRVKDGVQDLFYFALDTARGSVATAGNCTPVSGTYTFTASSFINANVFTPYFDEGRTLTITYSSAHVEVATIVSVLSGTQVTINRNNLPNPTIYETAVTFTVDDLGVYEKINNAIIAYNLESAQFTHPYAAIIYSTTEGLNNADDYGSFISVVATVYNPSPLPLTFNVTYGFNPYILEVPSSTKTVIGDTVYYDATGGTVGCQMYATVQKSLFVPCGGLLGAVDVRVINTGTSGIVQSGELVVSLNSTPCPPSLTSPTDVFTYYGNSGFCYVITGSNGLTTVSYTGLPSWAITDVNVPPASCSIAGAATDVVNKIYPLTIDLYNAVQISATAVVDINVTAPAVLASVADQSLIQGTAYSYALSVLNYVQDAVHGIDTVFSVTSGSLPPGIILNSSTGIISGTPSTTGNYTALITATNYFGVNVVGTPSSQPVNFIVSSSATLPQITSILSDFDTTNTPYTYQILASGNPSSYGASVGGNPISTIGLSINTSTGLITGTPTVSNTYDILLSATNAVGTTFATLVLVVGLKPVITSPTSIIAEVGVTIDIPIVASNSPTSYNAVNLPAGLFFVAPNSISGAATITGSYNSSITATNAIGSTVATVPVTVVAPPIIYSGFTDSVDAGSYYAYFIDAYNAPTSFNASYSGISGLAGLGLSISASSGLLSGIVPNNTASGVYNISISATNAYGTDNETLALAILPPGSGAGNSPVITSIASDTALVGTSYTYNTIATNLPTSYAAVSSPALSTTGLSFNTSTGQITGIPTAYGTFTITINASNMYGTSLPFILTLTIYASPVITSSLGTVYLTTGTTAPPYTITATGIPTFFSITNLPTGLYLNNYTGVITGQPTSAGTYITAITASNLAGSASANKTFIVQSAPSILDSSYDAISGFSGSINMNIAGTYTSVTATGLPTGVTLTSYPAVLNIFATAPVQYLVSVTFTVNFGSGLSVNQIIPFNIYPSLTIYSGMSNITQYLWAPGVTNSYTFGSNIPEALISFSGISGGIFNSGATLYIPPSITPGESGFFTAYASAFSAAANQYVGIYPQAPIPVISNNPGSLYILNGISGNFTFTDSNAYGPDTWAASGVLPTGISLNTSSGVLSWNSSAGDSGLNYATLFTATNASGLTSASSLLELYLTTTAPSVATTIASSGVTAYMQGTVNNFRYLGTSTVPLSSVAMVGFPSASFPFTFGPTGLSGFTFAGLYSGLDLYNQISVNGAGVPSLPPTTVYPCSLMLTNGLGSYSAPVTITFNGPPIPTWSNVAPAGHVGVSYTDDLSASYLTGYAAYPVPVSFAGSGFPSGLSISTGGVVTGTVGAATGGLVPALITMYGSDGQYFSLARQYSFS